MTQDDMLSLIMKGDISWIDLYNEKYDKFNTSFQIKITPQDIMVVLQYYLNDRMKAADLKKWADFILFNDGVEAPKYQDEDFYEPMWYVLQKITTPFIDGEIDEKTIRGYYLELSSHYHV